MTLTLRYKDFYRKYVNPTASKLRNPKIFKAEQIVLPRGAVIHYVAETDLDLGINPSHALLRSIEGQLDIFHVETLALEMGTARHRSSEFNKLKKLYHKRQLRVKPLRVLSSGVGRHKVLLVINYAFLPKLYTYTSNNLLVYQEWMNMRKTVWGHVEEIGSEREHFLRIKLPVNRPTKAQFKLYNDKFAVSALSIFSSQEALDLLEIWRIINSGIDNPADELSETTLKAVNLTFVETGHVIIINLFDLVTWSKDDVNNTSLIFLALLDRLIELRNRLTVKVENELVSSDDEADEIKEVIGQEYVVAAIGELGLAGKLTRGQQNGLIKIAGKYKTLPNPLDSTKTIEDSLDSTQSYTLDNTVIMEDSITIFDKSMLSSRLESLDELYVTNVLDDAIIKVIMSLPRGGILVTNIKTKDERSAIHNRRTYSVQTQPIDGKLSTFSFMVPLVSKKGTLFIGGANYRLERQRIDGPLVKTKSDQVGLTSYKGKMFVNRNRNSSNDYGRWIKRILIQESRLTDQSTPFVTDLRYGKGNYSTVKLPRQYTAIGETIESWVSGEYTFNFKYEARNKDYSEKELDVLNSNELVPCGRNNTNPIGMDTSGIIYAVRGSEVAVLGHLSQLVNPSLTSGPIEYTELSLFNKRIPLIIVFLYQYGLDNTLDRLNIPFKLEDVNVRVAQTPETFVLRLKDVKYVISINILNHSLLVGGLTTIQKTSKEFTSQALNRKSGYTRLFTVLKLSVQQLKEITLIFDMFIDPITMNQLVELNLPTTVDGLLLEANQLLTTDYIPPNPTYILRGYERLAGFLYMELVKALRVYRSKVINSNSEYTLNPRAVWLSFLQDPTKVIMEESNPISNLKEKEVVTFAGRGGRSARSMVKSTRGYTDGDRGVISEATPDSAKVGIRTYTSASPNIKSLSGITGDYDPDNIKPASLLSTSALLAPGVTGDDSKRVNFISIQNGHNVACNGYELQPFRTGYEQVVAHRVDDLFASEATQAGTVSQVTDTLLEITHSDGTGVRYELGVKHGTVAGDTLPHEIITDLKVGDKVKPHDIVAFHKGFFQRDTMNPSTVSHLMGLTAVIAFLESSATYEDGCTITQELANRMQTPTTKLRKLVIPVESAVHDLVSIGDKVEPESILCTIEAALTIDITQGNVEGIDALQDISKGRPLSEAYGTVTDIRILHYVNKNIEPSTTISALIKKDTLKRKRKRKELNDQTPISGDINESILIDGVKLASGEVYIGIYIDGVIPMETGDKLVVGNQLKTTVSYVDPADIVAEDGTKVDGTFGGLSSSNRTVTSPELMGIMNKNQTVASKKMADIYFE